MFFMGKSTERVFYFLTWLFQGSSFLVPRAYAVMHRMHHEFSDTCKDPHSPHFFKDIFRMMRHTARIYRGFTNGSITAESKFAENIPTWKALDKLGDNKLVRISWGVFYSVAYILIINYLNLSWFWMFLLPIHYLMGPIQGAFVNWCGHKYGYQNFKNGDHSHNTGPIGFFLLGELFQNNHHMHPTSPNFAQKWFEIDFAYPVLVVLSWFRIIRFAK